MEAYKLIFIYEDKLQEEIYTDYDLAQKMYKLFVAMIGKEKVVLNRCDCINKRFDKCLIELLFNMINTKNENK